MESKVFHSEASHRDERLDLFLLGKANTFTRSAIQRLIAEHQVFVDGKPVKKNYRLRGGEEIEVRLPALRLAQVAAQEIPLDIVYEDDDLIVVNKPQGMVVHPAPGNPDHTLVNALLAHCGDTLSGVGGVQRPGIVHRLDKNTSGLMVAAKNDAAHRHLSAQLKDRSLSRVYQAVVRGGFREDCGTVDAPIGRSPKNRKKMAVVPGGREAVTHWRVLARYPGYTHIECKLTTGRTHQIRVHLAHLGHPVAGDEVYGGRIGHELEGQCLHAITIGFVHPSTGEKMRFSSDLPDYFQAFIEFLNAGERMSTQ